MSTLATIIAVAAIVGAAVCWVCGVVFYLRTLSTISGPDSSRTKWLALVAWPFAIKRLSGAAAEHASKVNKSMVGFFVCLMIAVAAISAATNLARISR